MARKKSTKIKESPIVETEVEKEISVRTGLGIAKNWKILLFLFGFMLYANTINFDYALDDKIVIISNQITMKGFDGVVAHFFYDSMDGFWAEQYGVDVEDLNKNALVAGGRYRPLSLVTYAIEWELFGENPGLSHIINAILYGLTGLILFTFLLRLFPVQNIPIWQSIPFWATLLFIAHPLHVEVVANIKSRDEILSLLFGLLALNYVIDYAKGLDMKKLGYAAAFLFLSLMSKETTIAFVALGPILLYFFNIGDAKSWKMSFFGLLLAGAAYTAIRFMVIGSPDTPIASELMNSPFLEATEGQRLATIFLILAAYIKLLFFPFPLTHDYYPFHLPFLGEEEHYANWSNLGTIAGVVILLGLLTVIVKGMKSKNVYSFSALFFLGTTILVSNLFFPIGVFMNERFMYVPTIAFVIVLTYLCLEVLPQKVKGIQRPAILGFLGMVVLVFSVMTIGRSAAWKNDSTLALSDVKVSTGSAKVNMAAGDAIIRELANEKNPEKRQQMLDECYGYLKKSLDIYPGYFPPLDLLGKMYFEAGNYEESIIFYGYCAKRKPNDPSFVENIFIIGNKLLLEIRYDEAVAAYDSALVFAPTNKKYLLAAAQVSVQNLNNPGKGLPYMQKAYKLYPSDSDIAEKLAITYAMMSRFNDAIAILQPLYEANPENASIMQNLGIAYYQSGQIELGMALMDKSKLLKKSD
tara:strand:- start:31386 stop:33470 length:2085 start_codon:yes stop_codon:yes gene_type:complete